MEGKAREKALINIGVTVNEKGNIVINHQMVRARAKMARTVRSKL